MPTPITPDPAIVIVDASVLVAITAREADRLKLAEEVINDYATLVLRSTRPV